MKKLFLILLVIFGLAGYAEAYDTTDTGWKIEKFNVDAQINADQKINIKENISVDFNNLQKHGIYRYIPYQYERNGNKYSLRIKVADVTDDKGQNIPYKESRSRGKLELKIGDADKLISGKQIYNINYDVDRAINHFSDHDELYWNVTGNDWPVEIENAKTTISWPQNAKMTQNACYTGILGSNEQNCNINAENNKVTFSTKKALSPGEGMTIASGINLGIIKPYSWVNTLGWFLLDNWGYLIPIVILIFLLNNYYRNGRDPRGKQTIVPEFAPPAKLKPAELGTIYDEKVDPHDISAVIIDLAVKGYLKIKEIQNKGILGTKSKDYEFIATGKNQEGLDEYEIKILDKITEGGKGKLSNLKNNFYKIIPEVEKKIYKNTLDAGYFVSDPKKTRNKYITIGTVIIIFGMFFVSSCGVLMGANISIIIGVVLSGILFIIFSFAMSKRTELGVEITRQIKGFQLYMHTAERYRQKFNEDNKIFERFLPYAMVFGIVKEWANKFRNMQIPRPDWYEGPGVFYPWIFADTIVHMQSDMHSTMIAPSSAGAGGSGFGGGGVGGGFGGGGGGSW